MTGIFWRVSTVLGIVGLFYVGTGLHRDSRPSSALGSRVYAGGIGVTSNETETVMTTSEDGRTVYVWRYVGANAPIYLGKAEISNRHH